MKLSKLTCKYWMTVNYRHFSLIWHPTLFVFVCHYIRTWNQKEVCYRSVEKIFCVTIDFYCRSFIFIVLRNIDTNHPPRVRPIIRGFVSLVYPWDKELRTRAVTGKIYLLGPMCSETIQPLSICGFYEWYFHIMQR